MRKPKRLRRPNQLAKFIVDLAAGQTTQPITEETRNPHAVKVGRLAGLKGGKARALAATERPRIARKAAQKRWGKK